MKRKALADLLCKWTWLVASHLAHLLAFLSLSNHVKNDGLALLYKILNDKYCIHKPAYIQKSTPRPTRMKHDMHLTSYSLNSDWFRHSFFCLGSCWMELLNQGHYEQLKCLIFQSPITEFLWNSIYFTTPTVLLLPLLPHIMVLISFFVDALTQTCTLSLFRAGNIVK